MVWLMKCRFDHYEDEHSGYLYMDLMCRNRGIRIGRRNSRDEMSEVKRLCIDFGECIEGRNTFSESHFIS